MSEEKHMALEWLAKARADLENGRAITQNYPPAVWLRDLQCMLAEPRLPTELSQELVEAIWRECNFSTSHRYTAEKILRAIHLYVTRPKTKTVYRVISTREHLSNLEEGGLDLETAERRASFHLKEGHTVVIEPMQVRT